jgi:CRP-like cAMP-binding protein
MQLVEISHKVFLSEYCIVWATFIAIQVVGIDFGIVVGVLVAIVSHVISTAQVSSVNRISMSSRAVWTPSDYKLLHDHGYNPLHPKIVTLEITGTVFFGSSLKLLERITEEIGLNLSEEELPENMLLKSPHRSPYSMSMDLERRMSFTPKRNLLNATAPHRPPKLLVLDLTHVPNLDASASRGCFLQLAKMCAKRDMIVCAAGANPRVEWMLRSHDVAHDVEEEARVEAYLQSRTAGQDSTKCDRVLLFLTIYEALEFCENVLIHDLKADKATKRPSFIKLDQYDEASEKSIATIITHILGLEAEERNVVKGLEDERYHSELYLRAGQLVFNKDTHPSSFYIVIKGSVAVASTEASKKKGGVIVSGAGPVRGSSGRKWLDPNVEMPQGSLSSIWPVGGIFGYVDYMLERPRRFRAVSAQDGTIVANFTRSQMLLLRSEDVALDGIMQRLLLHASVMDLANCTCELV